MKKAIQHSAETASIDMTKDEFHGYWTPASSNAVTRRTAADSSSTVPKKSTLPNWTLENFCLNVGFPCKDDSPWYGKFLGMVIITRMIDTTPAGALGEVIANFL